MFDGPQPELPPPSAYASSIRSEGQP